MQLKEYQAEALNKFALWLRALEQAQTSLAPAVAALRDVGAKVPDDISNYPKKAWATLQEDGELPSGVGAYVSRTDEAERPIPHACFKVPTGGGKTLLAAGALDRVGRDTGFTLWIVPTRAIYDQTKRALWDREHPYRQMLERASGGKVKLLEKDDHFTADDIEHYLCIMLLMLPAANRQKGRDFLRMFRDSGRYPSFFPERDMLLADQQLLNHFPDLERTTRDGPVKESLFNVFKMLRPVVVLDEAHKAYGKKREANEEFVQSVNRLDPKLVIELSATPNRGISNLLVDIDGPTLHKEEMIKLPVQVEATDKSDWTDVLQRSHAKLEDLEAAARELEENEDRYIRPIAVVRVERTGKDQRDGERIHAEDVREALQELGVPADQIAIQASGQHDLKDVDLLSPLESIRWIITKAALMEGWDCSFASLLVLLDNTRAQTAITQLIGRVMRQPHAKRTNRAELDQCYVHCFNTDVGDAVTSVKLGLENEGLTGLSGLVLTDSGELQTTTIERRSQFRNEMIYLPLVTHADGADWRHLSYTRDLLREVDWNLIDPPDIQAASGEGASVSRATVMLGEHGLTPHYDQPRRIEVDTSVKIAWYTRRLADVVPNPWQAGRIVEDMIERLREADQSDDDIYGQRSHLAAVLREHVTNEIYKQTEQIFKRKLREEEVRFDLTTSLRHRLREESYEVHYNEDTDSSLERRPGQPLQLSLFTPQLRSQYDTELERRFARYLDEKRAIEWWHRIAVRQRGEYAIRGWKPYRIWPDFIAIATPADNGKRLLVFETKGDHLKDAEDTKYKQKVFEVLQQAFNRSPRAVGDEPLTSYGAVRVTDGPVTGSFQLIFDENEFPVASNAIDGS
ncbi:MAG: DEAD/DEAH box helicase family protein [Chloroflexota bacterium]|nr:DEAD/DEAH box helicase family protein [Chloroflexota bacterium]